MSKSFIILNYETGDFEETTSKETAQAIVLDCLKAGADEENIKVYVGNPTKFNIYFSDLPDSVVVYETNISD